MKLFVHMLKSLLRYLFLSKEDFFSEAVFMSRWKEWKTAPVHVCDREEYFISPHCDCVHFFLASQRPEKCLCQTEQVSEKAA